MVFPVKLYDDPEYCKLSWSPKCVLHVIYARSNGEQKCWPSATRIFRDLGISDRQVLRAIKELVKSKLIVKEIRAGKSSIYTPTPDYQSPLTTSHPCLPVTPDYQSPLTGSHPTPDCQSYEQSKEQSKEQTEQNRPLQVKTQENPQDHKQESSKRRAYDLMSSRPVQGQTPCTGTKVNKVSDLSKLILALPKSDSYPTNRKMCEDLIDEAIELAGGYETLYKAAGRYKEAVLNEGEYCKAPQYWLKDQVYLEYIKDPEPTKLVQDPIKLTYHKSNYRGMRKEA